jgi:diguanylate cyclase (GGDEF)-like protein/PAS domain S-box-containing protein
VIQHAGEGIFTVDLDGYVLSFNGAAEAMFGWSATEIIGRPVNTLLAPAWHDGLLRFLELVRQDTSASLFNNVDLEGVHKDGSSFPMLGSTSAIVEGEAPILSCVVRDLSEQKRYESALSHQALHDGLTELPNRVLLRDRLEEALARSRRHHRMCAVLYLDLDRFKAVNDKFGHKGGDRLLVEASARIKSAIRESDTLARLGGDEFVVLCEELQNVQDATQLAARVIAAVRAPFRINGDDAYVGASIGIAVSMGGAEGADTLLANADLAMYRAKDHGRGRFELFDEAMQRWVSDNAALEAALRQAVARDELHLVYQPIIATETGRIAGFEALLRWQRPGVGLVGPDDFIPMAEETGLISEIGDWLLNEACQRAAEWERRWPQRHLGIAVNISNRQLLSPDIGDVIRDALATTGLEPSRLTLELTESTLIDDAIDAQRLLTDLRGLGVNLSLDDFGTGYSSLTYLRAFPFNAVKIDRSFIGSLGSERHDTAIVAAVLGLANNLDLAVVAEGVETEPQLAVLIQLHCPYVQGFLFSPPRPSSDVAALLETPPERFIKNRR